MVTNHFHVAKSSDPCSALSDMTSQQYSAYSPGFPSAFLTVSFNLFCYLLSTGPHILKYLKAQPGAFFSFFTFYLTNFTQSCGFTYPLQADGYFFPPIYSYCPGFQSPITNCLLSVCTGYYGSHSWIPSQYTFSKRTLILFGVACAQLRATFLNAFGAMGSHGKCQSLLEISGEFSILI